jgi:hypothetical protein
MLVNVIRTFKNNNIHEKQHIALTFKRVTITLARLRATFTYRKC